MKAQVLYFRYILQHGETKHQLEGKLIKVIMILSLCLNFVVITCVNTALHGLLCCYI